jgi:hypothetical protein
MTRGILKGWVMISLIFSSGCTASGEQTWMGGVGLGVMLGVGLLVAVGGASVGVALAAGGAAVGVSVGAGAFAAQPAHTSARVNKTEYASRNPAMRKAARPAWMKLDFKLNLACV